MKSALVAAAIAALVVSAVPMTAQAAAPATSHKLYCTFMPWLKLCATAAPAAAAKPAPVAAVVPATKPAPAPAPVVAAAKPAAAHLGVKVYKCEKRADGKPYLLSCTWSAS
ncbi:MAG: hypothetical protein ACTHOR_14465 [Devosia sp.]|nr:hypothetical protein [Devosiaceae bacterium]